jgi:undecaprenyl phosphate-alpha-L-ara4N flippase subunit ArnE
MTQPWAIVVVLFAAVLGAFGQLYFKLGSDTLSMKIKEFKLGSDTLSMTIKELLRNRYLIIGVVLYAISTVMAILALKEGELSVLYPLIATSYIWATLLAKKVLKEYINVYKWSGIVMIIVGVIFIV